MAASALFFSVMGALVKTAGARLPTMEIVLARSLIVLVLSAWTLRAGGRSLWGGERRLLALRGVLGFIALTCFYYAVIHLPLAEATVIQYTNPLFAALLAAPLLGESMRATEGLLALVGLVGVAIVARPPLLTGAETTALDPFAVSVALAGAVFSACAYVMVRRLRREDPLVVVFYFALVSAIGSFPAVLPVFVPPQGREWAVLLGVGVTTHLGQVCLTMGLGRERAGRATSVGYLQIVFAALWGIALFGEVPDRWTAAGSAIVVAGTFLVARASPGTTRALQDPRGPAGA
jgi:drug/metabolite transporter (DMT)-like permease